MLWKSVNTMLVSLEKIAVVILQSQGCCAVNANQLSLFMQNAFYLKQQENEKHCLKVFHSDQRDTRIQLENNSEIITFSTRVFLIRYA